MTTTRAPKRKKPVGKQGPPGPTGPAGPAGGGGGGGGLHASTHANGGADELNVAGLSGALADPQPPIIGATATTAVAGNDARLTNARTPTAHTHPPADITGTAVVTADARLSDARTPTAHTHAQADVTSLVADLAAKEAANANIQAHIASAHAPSNAQKNSDITLAEIEAKLVGVIATHSHAGSADPFATFKGKTTGDISTPAAITPVNVTGLVFNYGIDSSYIIEIFGAISAAATTTGCALQFDLSAAFTSIWGQFYHQLANAGTLTGGSSIVDDASSGLSSGIPTAAGIYPLTATFMLHTGAAAGTAQLRFRSEVAAVITLKAGTVMRVQKVL